MHESLIIPALLVLAVLSACHARIGVYDAFVRGAREGLETAFSIAPYLIAILTAVALLRETGLMDAAQGLLAPLLVRMGLPAQSAPVVILRPLSGSAALAAVSEVMQACGADSRAARVACVISGAGETIFFTGSLYLGAAGIARGRYAVPAALAGYAACVLAAAALV